MRNFPITEENVEKGRLERALNCNVRNKDGFGDSLPPGKYPVISDSGRLHYVSITPGLSCDCNDWIMKGVEDEGWEEGLLCKHVLAVLFELDNEKVGQFANECGVL